MAPLLRVHRPLEDGQPDPAPTRWRTGDIVAFWGRGLLSRAIEWGTWGPSHVGIVCPALRVDRLLLFESTTLCAEPCELTGKPVEGVQAHDPDSRILRYDGKVERYRLQPVWELCERERDHLHRFLLTLVGKSYDVAGALVSGTRAFKFSRWAPYPDLGSLFCSELCAAALMRVGRLPLGHVGRYNPASLVRAIRRCGTYGPPEVLKR